MYEMSYVTLLYDIVIYMQGWVDFSRGSFISFFSILNIRLKEEQLQT